MPTWVVSYSHFSRSGRSLRSTPEGPTEPARGRFMDVSLRFLAGLRALRRPMLAGF